MSHFESSFQKVPPHELHAPHKTTLRGNLKADSSLVVNSSDNVDPSNQHASLDTVLIPREEYERLLKVAGQYRSLTRNLARGGVEEATINLLSRDDSSQADNDITTAPSTVTPSEDGGARLSKSTTPTRSYNDRSRNENIQYGHGNGGSRRNDNSGNDWADHDPISEDMDFGDGENAVEPYSQNNTQHGTSSANSRPHYDRYAHRTLIMSNLAEGVTHIDVTQAVRGGMLLYIYLRTHDRSCAISFLNPGDAKSFYDHIRRHDLYIKNKRVELRWAERHFVLPGHVANKIGIGATRNLMIRRCDPKLTPEIIRDDLEHIHNLIVIKVEFAGGNCFISTNSVHNAMFARTCMMSRLKYKGSKIEWDADECAQPLEKVQPLRLRNQAPAPKKTLNPMANRFQLLNLDDDDDDTMSPLATNTSVDILA
ncbi:RNA recognition motif containing protein [Zalerion maritima]|uniref:RNA recognition motif containing protein n=1 Tax=Zalerion maritima TaxID=339359 RepID=A0AAD5RGM2_9PEZI|nr:RNA recognition motif containing protein [Zalerion maritima]